MSSAPEPEDVAEEDEDDLANVDDVAKEMSAATLQTSTFHPTILVVAHSIDDIFFVAPSRVGDRVSIQSRVTRTFANTMEV